MVAAASCGRGGAIDAVSAPLITLHAAASRAQPAFVEVTGLSAQDLSSLRGAHLGDEQWQSLLNVIVGDDASTDSVPPVQGRYLVTGTAITFTPLYPFDPGRAYRIRFDPARLPLFRSVSEKGEHARRSLVPVVSKVVSLPASSSVASTVVTAVHPSGDLWPENVLRLYVEFSAPMGNASARDYVKIRDQAGREVAIPFLPVEADFWNADHTRDTLFFDPGRVKHGILPNQQLGRPLRAGHTYTLEIAAGWRDGQGRPLKAAYRRGFRVGPAAIGPIAPAAWRIAPPAARTRDPLVVTFPEPLDHGLLARALGVEGPDRRPLDGDISLEAADTRWVFTPRVPWQRGAHQLLALSILEDPAGNRIGRAFEVDSTESDASPAPDTFRVTFSVAEP